MSRRREVPAFLVVPISTPEIWASRGYPETRLPGLPGVHLGSAMPTEAQRRSASPGPNRPSAAPHTQSSELVQANLDRWRSCPRSRSPDFKKRNLPTVPSRGSPALARREAVTRLLLSRSLGPDSTSLSSCPLDRRLLALGPLRGARAGRAGSHRVPGAGRLERSSRPAGSLTDPEYLRGGLGEDGAEEIEKRPAGVPGPQPGLDEASGAPSSWLLNSCRDPAAAARPGDAARWARVAASSSWDVNAVVPRARSGGKSSREPARDGGAGGRRWARSGLLASAASPSPLLVLLLHGPRVSEKPRATAPGAERPAGESCCPNSPGTSPSFVLGSDEKVGWLRGWGQVESATRPNGDGGGEKEDGGRRERVRAE